MGNVKNYADKKDFENYYNCISSLKTRIGDLALKNTQNDMDELKMFFINPQTNTTRIGIFITLNSIQNISDYRIFISMCSELINVNIEFDDPSADAMGEGPYTFFYFIYQNPKKVKDVLNCAYHIYNHFEKNTHKVLEYLFRLGESFIICHSKHDEDLTIYMDFFIRRAENFLSGFHTIQRLLVDMHHHSFITILTSIEKENMIPTNGDMHCGGKVPYFITDSTKQLIYKPRDMRLDTIIMELLAFSNDFLKQEIKLPILATYLLPDNTGFMDIAIHAEEMDEQQAKSYFLKFGALLCFAKLFGIDDLHYENIMATEQGPVIIDLECALNTNSIKARAITDKALGFLKQAFISQKRKNATFLVNNNIFPLTYWKEYIYEGFTKAAQCFKNNAQAFIDKYSDFIHQPYYYRIVPIATGDFYMHMYSMINETSYITQQRINNICQSIIEYLNKTIFNKIIQNYLDLDLLFQNIYDSIRSGDIPLFQLAVTIDTEENIYYMGYINNQPFFKNPIIVNTLSAFKEELECKINWLNSDEAMRSLINFVTY